MAINYDLIDPAVSTGFVRELPMPAEVALNQILPDVIVPDIKARLARIERTNTAAKFRAYDAETPIGRRDTVSTSKIKLPPLGQKTVITEIEEHELNALRGQNFDALINDLYDDFDLNARAVRIRMELARADALIDGKVTISENGLVVEADYGVPGSHIVSFAVSPSDHTNADPLTELTGFLDTYRAAGGIAGAIWTSTLGLRHLLQSAKLRALAVANGITPALLSQDGLNSIFQLYGLPPVRSYDAQFDVDGSTVRAIPQDKYIIVPQNPRDLGYTPWGITAEALALTRAQRITLEDAPGLVGVVMEEGDPVRTWTKVAAVGIPVIENPKRLMVIDGGF